jgi:predicted double-glycine peptidase
MDKETRQRIADYALCHLGETAARVGNITEDMEEYLAHPDFVHGGTQITEAKLKAQNEERIIKCRNRAMESLGYIAQGFNDLRAFEAAQNEG